MRASSPTRSDFSLSKFPPSRIRNMNKDDYAHQRNLVLDKTIPQNRNDVPDSEVNKSKSPELNFRQSNINQSM